MIGYFGKIPSHGDFVSRGLPPALVEAWDAWLQQCMHESQRQLGDQWLTHYLTSPVWRFAISPGILGPEGLGGALMPSVDRVGRYFPLMIAATGSPPLLDWLQKYTAWYDEIEEVARASLDPAFSLARFDRMTTPEQVSFTVLSPTSDFVRFPFDQDVGEWVVAAALQHRSLWWTEGSPKIEPSLLMCAGMPPSQAFMVTLNGDWMIAGQE